MKLHPSNYTAEQFEAIRKAAWHLSALASESSLGEADKTACLAGVAALRAIIAPNEEMKRVACNHALAHSHSTICNLN
jgi:hypothetical protein